MTVSHIDQPSEHKERKAVFRLFGKHIQHSKAPLLHNFLFQTLGFANWTYELFESDDIPQFKQYLAQPATIGSAVTMPNKVSMIEHVDKVDEGAQAVGAINTIYTTTNGGKKCIVGTNTDTLGIYNSFVLNAPEQVAATKQQKLPGLVYGGGGACRSAVYALHSLLGCSTIYIINRFSHEVTQVAESMKQGGFTGEIIHVATPQQAQSLQTMPSLVVLTVPDFAPTTNEEKLAKATLDVFMLGAKQGAVLEMCYHPKPVTRLYKEFEANKWLVISGVEAMIYQGIAQQVLWTGIPLEQMPIKEVIEHVYSHLDL